MDKQTLSNYGWIVIAVLVLSVMIALSTPFGNYVKDATLSTLNGLFDTEEEAMNVIGQSAFGNTYKECNISVPWEESHTGTYYFERQSTDVSDSNYYVWKSNNKGVNSSKATSKFTLNAVEEATYIIEWDVSCDTSESFYFYVNGSYKSADEGIANGEITVTLKKGINTIEAIYSKNYKTHANEDCATVTLKNATINCHKNIATDECFSHVYDDGVITTKNTCTEYGIKTFTCIYCGKERYEDVVKLHTNDDNNDLCDVCGKQVAGIYDDSGKMIYQWEELVEQGIVKVSNSGILTTRYFQPTAHGSASGQVPSNASATSLIGKLIVDKNVTSLGEDCFNLCNNLTQIILPNTITSINSEAFEYCDGLTSIIIPDSVTSIGTYAFSNCTNLTSINIPDNVTSIKDYTFYKCTSLTTIAIPNSVTDIGSYAFCGCNNLSSITIPNNVITIGNSAFASCKSLTKITIPNNVTTIGNSAFSNCTNLTSIIIPKNVSSIGRVIVSTNLTSVKVDEENPYYDSRNGYNGIIETATNTLICMDENMSIPNSVTRLGDYLFENKDIVSFIMPNNITHIGKYTFSNCKNLTSITLSENLEHIGEYAFYYCKSLINVTLPDSLKSIDRKAFSCSGLTTITIPKNIESIGWDVCGGCNNLTSIYLAYETTPNLASSCFSIYGPKHTFYFKNNTTYNDFTTSYYTSSYGTKSTNFNW